VPLPETSTAIFTMLRLAIGSGGTVRGP